MRSACQRTSWFSLARGGGVKTYFAPSKPGRSSNVSSMKKYCVQVSAQTFQPFVAGTRDRLDRLRTVTWTT